MAELLKDLERWKPGDPQPPINLGAYDNPLLWNMLDPYGADRPHQRRPSSVSRSYLELHQVPPIFRDHCTHRFIPWARCIRNLRPITVGTPGCHEFETAWQDCRSYERYRAQLIKDRFMELTKDYTQEDREFFPDQQYHSIPYSFNGFYWAWAASARLAGWDDQDPENRAMDKTPNRAMMRSEFCPTNFERKIGTAAMGNKVFPPEAMEEALPEFPLPDEKKVPSGYYSKSPV